MVVTTSTSNPPTTAPPEYVAPAYPSPAVPVLRFKGSFLADVSTVNNDPTHFNTSTFRSNFQEFQNDENYNGWWNPDGTGTFALKDCMTTTVMYSDGTEQTHNLMDSVLGLPINGAREHVQGKIVDLDSEMQSVSMIFGLRINLGGSLIDAPDESSTTNPSLESVLSPNSFIDLWPKYDATDQGLAAVWQGPLDVSQFTPGNSRFMKECEELCGGSVKLLMLQLNVDSFDQEKDSPTFRYGRVVGSIRPYLSGDPVYFGAGRVLRPIPESSAKVFNAYSHIQVLDGKYSLYVDVGNALGGTEVGGDIVDFGALYACILPGGQSGVAEGNYTQIGEVKYQVEGWFESTAGIIQVPLTEDQMTAAESAPLGLIGFQGSSPTLLLAEPDDGYSVRADNFVYRVNPDDNPARVDFYVTKFGQRQSGTDVSIGFDSTIMRQMVSQYPGAIPGPTPGVPQSAVHISADSNDATGNGSAANGTDSLDVRDSDAGVTVITSNKLGVATAYLTGSDPSNPRKYIDGQVYGLRYGIGETPPPVGATSNASEIVSVLLFDKYEVPEKPSWVLHIAPIFQQYANLYPSMRRIVDLADYASCITRIWPLRHAFGAEVWDPHYMPVTRDLSKNKKTTILNWLKNVDPRTNLPLYMDVDCKQNLMAALQTAIELEHATIPPYLNALYSIKPGCNQYIADTIQSVVIQEMLHFAIACNILISVGGSPNINKPNFVPKYPGPLPGGLRRGLIVRLRKCSIEQLRMFMSIEEPREVVITDDGDVDDDNLDNTLQTEKFTIGFVYDEIKRSLRRLSKSGEVTFSNTENQIDHWSNPGDLKKISSLHDAIAAINQIEDEGEGGRPFEKEKALDPTSGFIDPDTGLPQLSHYYKFAEIVYGKRLVVHEDGKGFSYTGDDIPFDEEGVYNMMDDPMIASLQKGSQAHALAENFSKRYQALLNGLHRTFNGDPDYVKQAIASMFQLTIAAEPLMTTDAGLGDGTTVGLSFEQPFQETPSPGQ